MGIGTPVSPACFLARRDMRFTREMLEYFRQQGELGAAKRNESLTPEERTAIARKAANARWSKVKKKSKKGKRDDHKNE